MGLILRLLAVGLIPIGLSIIFYFVKKQAFFNKISEKYQQTIIGLAFGVASILGTVLGVDVGGATANARDAAPLCAGLLFGGPAGIISGIMGGVYRFVATYFGAGDYSQIACTISTIVAGFFAAFLRKNMFENKRPTWIFGLATAIVMEVFHMTVLFITHLDNSVKALEIVEICTIPMIICNAFSVTVSIVILDIISKSYKKIKQDYRKISQQIQTWLLLVVVLAYFATTTFVYALQTGTAKVSAEKVIDMAIADVTNTIEDLNEPITAILISRRVGENGYIVVVDNNNTILNISMEGKEKYKSQDLSVIGIENIRTHLSEEFFETNVFGEQSFCKVVAQDGYYVLAVMSHKEVYASRDGSVYINSYMEVLVFASLFFIIYELIKKKVVNNIKTVNRDLSKIIGGDLSVSVNVNSSEEFFSLSNDINSTVSTLKKYIDEAARRIDAELAFAKNIQHSALPSVFPAYPSIGEFDIYADMITAKEVGGDFYDFYLVGKNKLAFMVADVSGKGIPAAMFMMRAKTLIKSLCESGLELSEVFSEANNKLCEGNDAGMFVTAWMGILDYKSGILEYVNAGHNPPMLLKDGKWEKLAVKPMFILAGMEGIKYKSQTVTLKEGDKIYLYTDGVTEATSKNEDLYGESRLLDFLNSNLSKDVKEIILGVKKSIDEFVGEVEQFDDITMLCLEYNGNGITEEREFPAKDESFEKVNAFIEGFLEKAQANVKSTNQILVCCEEIFVNISKYAYNGSEGKLKVELNLIGDNLTIRFTDSGIRFNPLDKEDPDITLSAEDRKIGGLGIFMVKKMMDAVNYEYTDNKNKLTIVKKIK